MLVEDLFQSYSRNSLDESKSSSEKICEEEKKIYESKAVVWNDSNEWNLYTLIKKRVEDEDVFMRTFNTSKQEAYQHYKDNFNRIFRTCRKIQIEARLNSFNIQADCLQKSLPYQFFIQDKAARSQSQLLSIPQAELKRQAKQKQEEQTSIKEEIEEIQKMEKHIKAVSQTKRWNQSDELILVLLWKLGMLDTSITSKMLSYSDEEIKIYLKIHNQELEHKFAKLIISFKFSPDEIRQLSNKNLAFLLQIFFQKQQDLQKKKKPKQSIINPQSSFRFDLCFSEIKWKTYKK